MKTKIEDKRVISWRPRQLSFSSSSEAKFLRENVGRDALLIFETLLDLGAQNDGKVQVAPRVPYSSRALAKECYMLDDTDALIVKRTIKALKALEVITVDKLGVIYFVNNNKWFGKALFEAQTKKNRAEYMKDYRKEPKEKKINMETIIDEAMK